MQKEFWKSKAKWGALLLVVSTVAGAVGGYLSGTLDAAQMVQALMGVGAGVGIWGVRDAQK